MLQRRHEIRDEEWERIQDLLPGRRGTVGKPAVDNRSFVNAVLWIARTGAPWRDLPERYGNWNTVWRRFHRWALKGIWDKLFDRLSIDADLEEMLMDATIIRAHQHAAGAKKKTAESAQDEGLGRSRGGFSSKIHALVDALGNPIKLIITGGQVNDITQGAKLITGKQGKYILGDKGYDSDELVETITRTGAIAVIPSRSNRKQPRDYDKHIYKDRNLVERFFNKIKQFRRIATRYEKTIISFMAMVNLAAIMVLLR